MSDRPPTILSPYGEGYCRHCRFVVGLDQYGLLDEHRRGTAHRFGDQETKPCKGSSRRPAAVTPYISRKAAFRTTSPDTWCPACQQAVKTTRKAGGVCYVWHQYPPVDGGRPAKGWATNLSPDCPNSYRPVPR